MSASEQENLNISLSSLAMLSVRLQRGKDYLDYLYGFVVEALWQLRGQTFDAVGVQKIVEREFGLRIPAPTFALYLKRLVKTNVIKPISSGLQYTTDKLPPSTIKEEREAFSARVVEVTDELAGFAYSRFSLAWDDKIAATALTEFLRKYSIDFLHFAEKRSALPDAVSEKAGTSYVVAAFVTHCAKENNKLFESVKVLVQSHILSNALLCPDLRDTGRGFNGVHFLVDTRFLLKAFDLESEYDTDNTHKLLAAIRKLKGVVCVFPETKEEIRSVLKGIARGFQQGNFRGAVSRELLRRQRGVIDVVLAESHLEDNLKKLSISTFPSPRYDEGNFAFQIDELELRNEIENEVGYSTDRAAEHDIRAVRHIFALRRGQRVSQIEDCGYVFLTTNSALSRAAFRYGRQNSVGWIFSAVVTDYHLSHLAWLKSPLEVADLPAAEILASCHAAMRPKESFWRQYLEELDRLKKEGKVSERDHEVLRFSLNAPEELMEMTRGDAEGINEKNIHEVLERLEQTYSAEKEEALKRERAGHEATLQVLARYKAEAEEKDRKEKAKPAELEAEKQEIKKLKAQLLKEEGHSNSVKEQLGKQEVALSDLTSRWDKAEDLRNQRAAIWAYCALLAGIIILSGLGAWGFDVRFPWCASIIGSLPTRGLVAVVIFVLSHLLLEVGAKKKPRMSQLWPFQEIQKFRKWLWTFIVLSFAAGVLGNLYANRIQKNLDQGEKQNNSPPSLTAQPTNVTPK